MKAIPTALPGCLVLEPTVFGDERGFFMESFNEREFAALTDCPQTRFVQDNHSRSTKGVLRGLHLQLTEPQGKLVRAVSGAVWDVAVDVRDHSPTFGRWHAQLLSADNKLELWIPPGMAHGFLVLSDWADVLYKASNYYAPHDERSIAWNDPQLAIDWPLAQYGIGAVKLSPKDAAAPLLAHLHRPSSSSPPQISPDSMRDSGRDSEHDGPQNSGPAAPPL